MDIIHSTPQEAILLLERMQTFIAAHNLRRIHAISPVPINPNLPSMEFSHLFLQVLPNLSHEFNRLVSTWKKSLYNDTVIEIVYVLMVYVYYGIEYRDRVLDPNNQRHMDLLRKHYTNSDEALASSEAQRSGDAQREPCNRPIDNLDPHLCLLRYQINVYQFIYMNTVDATNGDLLADRKIISDPSELVVSSEFSFDGELMQVLRSVVRSGKEGVDSLGGKSESIRGLLRSATLVQGCKKILHTHFLDQSFCKFLVILCVLSTVSSQEEAEFAEVKFMSGGNMTETILADEGDVVSQHHYMTPENWIENSIKVYLIETPLSVHFDFKYKVARRERRVYHRGDQCDDPFPVVMWWDSERHKSPWSRGSTDSNDSLIIEEQEDDIPPHFLPPLGTVRGEFESKSLRELTRIPHMEALKKRLFLT
mmetsp:Transcript_3000/g.11480  ORF Transcript_3000/g.11480 Transcript_3000/m.11480 type:complete len:422 (-) Transcript_3000:47-1312(-)|eukprot:CAMPEP_0117438586 /NCGR_PEP_ID=MMETSP0759-20121206/2129_1 /TAXON_ID=63605 /ORGANISM="Percolomonas cosmopolitus, Strain WS" /LENGTH=421 /DNA_ID=CAMNT_0005230281 /DNA_START=954 /DNA_END=2219 /DNA_ORIENTATION=-